MKAVKNFFEAYDEVFDERGNFRNLEEGKMRQSCRRLIKEAQKLENGTNFGNLITGEIKNSDDLRKLHFERARVAFINAYEKAFDKRGLLKDCSTKLQSELIETGERLDPCANFRNKDTDMICMESLERMKELYIHVK